MPKVSNSTNQVKPTPLLKYTIENLSKEKITSAQIQIGEKIKEYPKFTAYKFYINFDPTLANGPIKKVSGLINIPNGTGPFPLIIMIRGYVDPKSYFPGNGTFASAQFFANNGFVTISPDFLGYAESDKEADNIFEARFQTYTTILALLKTVEDLKTVYLNTENRNVQIDIKNIFLWGHSNGGQIALTVLEITQKEYPTVLWAPVSLPFPGSILYYVFESEDQGKYLVNELAKFNETYDTQKFSLTNYLNQIKAPIQINQGTNDHEVPFYLTDDFNDKLKKANVSTIYIKYPDNDHNMLPNWNSVIENNLIFFQKHIK